MRTFVLILLSFSFFGCGTSREKWTSQHCSANGSYQMGLSDAKHKRRTGVDALKRKCSPKNADEALASYEKGFKAGGGKVGKDYQYGQDVLKDAVNIMNNESKPTKKTPSKSGNDSQ